MDITIIGAGAVGGICGAHLTKAGRNVLLVEPHKEHRERIREGIFIDGVRGEMTVPMNAIAPEELSRPLEMVLLAVKSPKTPEALQSIRSFVRPETLIVSLQNGINEDVIVSEFGPERVIGGIVGWGATNAGPGHLSQTSEGKFTIGELNGAMTERLEKVKAVLDDIAETILTSNIYGHLWAKLSINCLIAGCSVLGVTVGEALAPERNKRLFIKLVGEVVSVAEACGIKIEKYEGVVDPTIFRSPDEEGIEFCFQILDMMAAVHGRIYPGPLQDIEKGLKTEVDYVTGYCADKARERGVPAPINATIREIIEKMETGEVIPSPENLAALEAVARN